VPWALPLVGLDVLVVVLWTIAAALAIALIMTKIGNAISAVPVIGGPIGGAVKSIARAVTNACGALMGGIEQLVGAGLHLLARYVDKYFQQFVVHASLIGHLARIVGGELYRVSGLHAIVHRLSRAVHVVLHRFVVIGREVFHLQRLVKRLEHDISKGIGDDVLPRLKSLDRELARVEHKVIPAIESDVTAVEHEVGALRRWIANTIPIPGTAAFTAAIAVALGLLGLGGLRCNSLRNALGRRGCGLWQGLEDLLGLLADVVIVTDLCALLPELERLFAFFEAPLVELIASAADAVCARPSAGWVELEAPPLELPQVSYSGPSIGG
jgi:hypothetical protein